MTIPRIEWARPSLAQGSVDWVVQKGRSADGTRWIRFLPPSTGTWTDPVTEKEAQRFAQ